MLRYGLLLVLGLLLCRLQVCAQSAPDSAQRPGIQVHAYAEAYYAADLGTSQKQTRPLFFNFNQQRQFSINLALVEVCGQMADYRFRVTPALGTYMQANYGGEPEGFRYLFEANAGVRLSPKRNVWLDAGILPSPYGYEGAVSLFQNTLTRSLAAEYSPYFLTGARLSAPLGAGFTGSFYLVNGWQIIRETNRSPSAALQLQYQPTDKWLLNYSTYLGNERQQADTASRARAMRHYHNLYAVYTPDSKTTWVALADFGLQNGYHSSPRAWWTAHLTCRRQLAPRWQANARAEVFADPHHAHIYFQPYRTTFYGASLGAGYGWPGQALLRLEARSLRAQDAVFTDEAGAATRWNYMLTTALSVYW